MKSTCRLCARVFPSTNATPIFSFRRSHLVLDMIIAFCPIRIERADNFPQNLCDSCMDVVQKAYELREKSVRSDINFRNINFVEEDSLIQLNKPEIIIFKEENVLDEMEFGEETSNFSSMEQEDDNDDEDYEGTSERKSKRAKKQQKGIANVSRDEKAKKFWHQLESICKDVDETVIYLLKALDFNSSSSFKDFIDGEITLQEICCEMEKFVQSLPPGSHHLESINTKGKSSKNFKISLGQKSALKSTLDAMVAKIEEIKEKQKETSRNNVRSSLTRQRELIDVDLQNIQAIWDQKLKSSLQKNRVKLYDHFPILRSRTDSFPYKFWIKCPSCHNEHHLSITLDVRGNGSMSPPHYRFSHFVKHILKCLKE